MEGEGGEGDDKRDSPTHRPKFIVQKMEVLERHVLTIYQVKEVGGGGGGGQANSPTHRPKFVVSKRWKSWSARKTEGDKV